MRRLRVLHVAPYFAPAFVYGGPPRSILGLCKALGRADVDVDVITTTANGPGLELPAAVAAPHMEEGVPVRYFPRAKPRWLWNARGLQRAVADVAVYDLVHVHGLWHLPGWHAARAARRAGIPYVISPRGMLEPEALAIRPRRKALAFQLIERRNLEHAAFLHATSSREARTLTDRALNAHVLVAPNGVDVVAGSSANPSATLARYGIAASVPFVLFLGRVHPIKRLDLLAAAMRQVRTSLDVVIAGPDECGHRAAVEPMFLAGGIHVTWTGTVEAEQKTDLLAAARVLVMCSDSESFGLSVAEAMAAGTPVVVTRTCAWPEIEQQDAGRWVPQRPDAIAAAIDEIAANPELGRAMGERGRALVARQYSWDVTARTVAEAYGSVAAASGTMTRPE